jgi:hypothetical protein
MNNTDAIPNLLSLYRAVERAETRREVKAILSSYEKQKEAQHLQQPPTPDVR